MTAGASCMVDSGYMPFSGRMERSAGSLVGCVRLDDEGSERA